MIVVVVVVIIIIIVTITTVTTTNRGVVLLPQTIIFDFTALPQSNRAVLAARRKSLTVRRVSNTVNGSVVSLVAF
jgi:hypothetical protein